jgi:Galactose oxidase, central domain
MLAGHGMTILDSQLFIFGGEGQSGAVSGRLFRLTFNPTGAA